MSNKIDYAEFLARKKIIDYPTGIPDPPNLNSMMMPFQADVTRWSLIRGRANIWARYGLGKTLMELVWSQVVCDYNGLPSLIAAPLAVSHQTIREGKKFGIPVNWCSTQDDVKPGVNITNYQKLHKFDLTRFGNFAADESGILKNFTGKIRNEIIERTSCVPFRLGGSATPSPNDFMELGNHAEFMGVMTRSEMLSMFFVHDGGDTSQWRLKGHAESEFWKWLCSFSVMITKPSDFGYEDGEFKLPPREVIEHVVDSSGSAMDGFLFELPAMTLDERRRARRNSLKDRCRVAADIASSSQDPYMVWCDMNEESKTLAKNIAGAYEVTGSMTDEEKERGLLGFIDGTYRVLVSKPTICGYGMNFQHCAEDVFTGLSDSFEQIDQAAHRIYRFGQKRPVKSHIVISRNEGAVLANIQRKQRDFEHMTSEMLKHMRDINSLEIRGTAKENANYNPTHHFKLPDWMAA